MEDGDTVPLFTFYLEYKGGTYISQVRAQSYKSAPKAWAEKLDTTVISQPEKDFKEKLLKSIIGEPPTPIEGVSKTWCCPLVHLNNALAHFTQTSE
jgi:hypothetical protein